MRGEWLGFTCEHRSEDLAVIADLVRAVRPVTVVELGTAGGGFAAFLASVVAPWGGRAYTFDRVLGGHDAQAADVARALATFGNLAFVEVDVLAGAAAPPAVAGALGGPGPVLLYCDDGDKEAELRRYAPLVPAGGVCGCHDYGTEVDEARAEALMAGLGYVPLWHERFAALAHPEWYPKSLTRFWRREGGSA